MDSRDRNSLLFPLIVLLGAMFPFAVSLRQPVARESGPSTQAPTQGAGQPASQAQPGSSQRRARSVTDLVKQFFGLDLDKDVKGQDFSRDSYSVDFVIATVPDPIDSQLPYLFDSSLESIRLAARADGFVLDRSYLPWSRRPQARDSSSQTPRRPWHEEPGVLLFRRRNPKQDGAELPSAAPPDSKPPEVNLLAVLLVGETPTAGIHKEAFAKALKDMAETRKLKGIQADPGCPIRVLGPSFTGSATSLRLAIDKWLKQTEPECKKTSPRVEVISGTATAVTAGTIDDGDADQDNKEAGPKKISFRAMVPYDADVFRSVWKYLAAHHYCKVALLAEDSTSYGKVKKEEPPKCNGPGTSQEMEFINMSFPLYIAQLRREADIERKATQQTNATATDSRAFLPMPEEDERTGKGVPHSFSTFSVTYAELNLTNLLTTISREGIRAVGILATDVRDTIFLAREIREHAPDMLIFTFNSDLLYTHPEANLPTYGMLVFTPYPLINANQLWSYPFRGNDSRLQFSSQFATGVYNAAIALLEEQGREDEKQTQQQGDREQEGLVEYGPSFEENPQIPGPALWVTVVGNRAMMPIAVLRADRREYMFAANLTKGADRKPPGLYSSAVCFGIVALSLMLVAFSGILTYLNWPTRKQSSVQDREPWFAWRLGDPVFCSYQALSRFYLLVCCGVLLGLYAFIVFLFALPVMTPTLGIRRSLVQEFVLFPLLRATLLALLVATVVMLIAGVRDRQCNRTERGTGSRKIVNRAMQFLVIGGSASVLSLMVVLIVRWWQDTRRFPYEAAFDYLRAFNWSAGVSPLLPVWLTALAAFLWGFGSFLRLRMIDGIRTKTDEGQAECVFLGLEQDRFKGLSLLESRIQDFFEQWSVISNIWQVGLLVVAAALAIYFFYRRFLPTVEGRVYDWLFASAYFFVYGVLAVESARLWLLWRELHFYLKRVAQLPLRAAFARYHENHPSLARISFATAPPTFTVLEFSVEEASELVRSAHDKDEHVAGWLKEVEPRVREAQNALTQAHKHEAEKNPRKSLVQRNNAQCAISAVVRPLGTVMEHHWRQDPAEGSKDKDPFYGLAEELMAGRAVHFISYILPAIRNLSAFVLAGLLLMLFSVVSYPFQPQNDFLLFNWIVILAFIATALTIVVQMERDFVMSSLNGSDPGKVNFSFDLVFRFLAYGVIPLTALLGAQFPDALRKVLSVFSTQSGS